MSANITITGDSQTIYNIVKESRIRIKRGLIEISGDVDNPYKKLDEKGKKITKKEQEKQLELIEKDKPDVKTKEEKGGPDEDKEDDSSTKTPAKKKPAAKKKSAAKKASAK